MTDLDELEKKAREATPGPWHAGSDWVTADLTFESTLLQLNSTNSAADGFDLEFIAAANPSAILELIARCRKAEARVAELEAVELSCSNCKGLGYIHESTGEPIPCDLCQDRLEEVRQIIATAITEHCNGGDLWLCSNLAAKKIAAVPLFLRAPQAVPEWQPIETAPKDGTAILVTNGSGVWIAKHKAVYQSGYKPDSPWFCLMLNKDHIPARHRRGFPTHWMPLPAAPSPEGEKE